MFSKQSLILAVAAFFALPAAHSADPQTCDAALQSCAAKCAQHEGDEEILRACKSDCQSEADQCVDKAKAASKDLSSDAQNSVPSTAPVLTALEPTASEPKESLPVSAPTPPAEVESATQSEPVAPGPESPPANVEASTPTPAEPAAAAPTPPIAATPAVANAAPMSEKQKPQVPVRDTKKAVVKERELNGNMLVAIRNGDLKAMRRLIQTEGVNPTYVYGYEFSPQSRRYEGSVARLWLTDLLNDASSPIGNAIGLDKTLTLFLELGMDIKATLLSASPANRVAGTNLPAMERTAWWPSLRVMEIARDRDVRLRAFETALQVGLEPTDETGAWLFAELPQVCGRDRSKFAIQVVDLLVKYRGRAFQSYFRRDAGSKSESVADVIDRSFAQSAAPKTAYEKEQFAMQDQNWENCGPLSRRINRFLEKGN